MTRLPLQRSALTRVSTRRWVAAIGVAGLLVGLAAVPAGAASRGRAAAPAPGDVVAGEPTTAPDPARVRCDEGHWPATVQGMPAGFDAGDAAGYRIWHDGSGWHLRTTTPSSDDHVFTGIIHSSGNFQVVARYLDESVDRIQVEGQTLRFEFHTHDRIDGLDFVVGCTDHVSFALQAEGSPVPAARIRLGHSGSAPGNPFTVFRTL
jgi:hypothetical protein